MKIFHIRSFFFILVFALLNPTSLLASFALDHTELEKDYIKAASLLASFKNDQALIIIDNLIDTLESTNQLHSPFGLRVLFCQSEALEKDHKDEIALQKLLYLKELSFEKEVWDVYGNTGLILARLYEKIGHDSLCLIHLREVQSLLNVQTAIDQYSVDSLYPLFAIRISSYNRIFADQDSALYYAKEAIRTSIIYNQKSEEGVGHMLMGLILSNKKSKLRLYHQLRAAEIFKQIEDYTGYSFLIGSISGWYQQNGNPEMALIYNDSSILAANKSIEKGHEERNTLYYQLRSRSEIFKTLGQTDSAWFYLKKGYQMELDFIHQTNNEKVIAAEGKYQDEKKSQKITTQQSFIEQERKKKNSLIGVISMVLLFAAVLSYLYLRLLRANKKTKNQALVIGDRNKELSSSLKQQIILQSEVHHRVKNNLQVIISLLDLQKEEVSDLQAKEQLKAMGDRIYSMAAIHDILYQQEDMTKVKLKDYAENLCMEFSNFSLDQNKPEFHINLGDHYFNLETSMPIGIMLTELLTNSLKYARVLDKKLIIEISLKKLEKGFCFIYKDNGPGFSLEGLKKKNGKLGMYLLKSMSRQLNGHIESSNDNGALCKIFFNEKNS